MARIHHQGVQQSLLHQTTATPPTECTERTEPSCRERTPTDGTDGHRLLWCAVLPQNTQNTQNLAAWVWQGCHTLLICEHPCSSVGGSSLPEGSVCAFCGNIFSPTDGTDEHRWLGGAVLPQNIQNWAAWVWQGCHTLLICAHPCHLWEALLCQKVLCVPCVLREYLFSHGFLLRRVWHFAIPTPPAMGYYPTEYAEFTEPPAEKSLPRISQIYTDT